MVSFVQGHPVHARVYFILLLFFEQTKRQREREKERERESTVDKGRNECHVARDTFPGITMIRGHALSPATKLIDETLRRSNEDR